MSSVFEIWKIDLAHSWAFFSRFSNDFFRVSVLRLENDFFCPKNLTVSLGFSWEILKGGFFDPFLSISRCFLGIIGKKFPRRIATLFFRRPFFQKSLWLGVNFSQKRCQNYTLRWEFFQRIFTVKKNSLARCKFDPNFDPKSVRNFALLA